MTYTEVKVRNRRRYYYRVLSIRNGRKVAKERIYLGVNIKREALSEKEKKADMKLWRNIELGKLTPKIIEVLKSHNVKKAGIFGSYAKGQQAKGSDIDILIEPPKGIGFGFAGIQMELEKKLGRKVDLVSYNGISPYLKDEILSHEVRII